MEFSITTHIVPKKNALRTARSKTGKPYVYKDYGARSSEDEIRKEIWTQYRGNPLMTGPVKVKVLLLKTRGDAIGLLETLLDAMQGIVYKNDNQVVWGEYLWSSSLVKPTTAVITVAEVI